MTELLKTLKSKTRIQYQDCDPFNHLNNARYIDYMVAARTEQLLVNYEFNTSELVQKQGIGWVAAQTQISYLFPAVWMEIVTIETRLISFSETSVVFEAFMWDENRTHIKALMWAKLVHFDIRSKKSRKHTPDLMELFTKVHFEIENNPTFEERVKSLRQLNQST